MFENAFHPISPSCHSSSLLSADPRLCKSPSKPFVGDFSRNAIAIAPLADANAPIAVSRHVIQSESSCTCTRHITFESVFPGRQVFALFFTFSQLPAIYSLVYMCTKKLR